jgi:hypothetical protein
VEAMIQRAVERMYSILPALTCMRLPGTGHMHITGQSVRGHGYADTVASPLVIGVPLRLRQKVARQFPRRRKRGG